MTLGALVLAASAGNLAAGRRGGRDAGRRLRLACPGTDLTVLQTGSYSASWTIATGTTVSATTVVTQTSRPIGVAGCDVRWVPVASKAVTGTSYKVDGLAANRCYRFLLVLTTGTGKQSVTSAPIIPAPAGLGATAAFTNPFVDGVVAYETKTRIGWAERDTFGSKIVSRALYRAIGDRRERLLRGRRLVRRDEAVVHRLHHRPNRAAPHCYRYRLILQDAAGFRSDLISGALRVAPGCRPGPVPSTCTDPPPSPRRRRLTWCVAASSQMMLNMILGQSDSSSASQSTYISYGQANDAGSYSGGTDPAGWAAILNRYGGATYAVQRFADSARRPSSRPPFECA